MTSLSFIADSRKQLPFHEWFVITVVIALIASCVFVSMRNTSDKIEVSESFSSDKITVYLAGAVETPIELEVDTGTRISELKNLIKLLPDADVRFFNKKRKLNHLETVVIPIKKQMKKQVQKTTRKKKSLEENNFVVQK